MANTRAANTRAANTPDPASGGGSLITITCAVGAYTWAGTNASFGNLIAINCTKGAYTWTGVSAAIGGLATINLGVGAYSWAGIAMSLPGSSKVLLRAPFFQADLVPGPVTVLLRKWSGASWIDDGIAQTVTQLTDANIPNSYTINATYTPNSDGSYQAVPVWNLAAVATWTSGTYAANALTRPAAVPNGHYYKVIAGGGGASGGTEPSGWPTNGGTISDGALTWQDQGQCLYDGDVLYLAPSASAVDAAAIVAALKADSDWQTILANVNGVFDYNTSTNVITLKNKSGGTTLATLTLTLDGSGNVTHRASS